MPHRLLVPDPDVTDALELIGERLRTGRYAIGLSQARLGRMCGLSQASISRLERGLAPSLRLERYARVVSVLHSGRALGPWLPQTEDDGRLIHRRTRRPTEPGRLMPPRA